MSIPRAWRGDQKGQYNYMFWSRISKEEVIDALRKMKIGTPVGLDRIPVDIWNSGSVWVNKDIIVFNEAF